MDLICAAYAMRDMHLINCLTEMCNWQADHMHLLLSKLLCRTKAILPQCQVCESQGRYLLHLIPCYTHLYTS